MRSRTVWIAVIISVFGIEAVGQTRSGSFRWDRQRITSKLTDLSGVSGVTPSDVFVVGTRGTVLHFDGTRWQEQKSGTSRNLSAVWAVSPTDVFAVGFDGLILHFDGKDVAAANERNHSNSLRDLGRFSGPSRRRRPLGNDPAARRQGLACRGKRDSSRPARGVGLLGWGRVCRRSSRHSPPLRRQRLERGRGRLELEMAVQCHRRHVSLGYVCCRLERGNWRRSADGGFSSLQRPGLDGRPRSGDRARRFALGRLSNRRVRDWNDAQWIE